MTDLQTLFRTIDELTPEEKQQVVEYIQEHQVIEPSSHPRVFDLHADVISMRDDFDEERCRLKPTANEKISPP